MLTLRQLLSALRLGDWFTSIDLTDAYFHVAIHPDHRQFLRFAFKGTTSKYLVLPFGLSLAPQTFTKCVKAVLAPLHSGEGHLHISLSGRLGSYCELQRASSGSAVADSVTHPNVGFFSKYTEKFTESESADLFSRAGNMLPFEPSMPVRAQGGCVSQLPRPISVGTQTASGQFYS